jgi:DNA-directed RNA polymerase subunit RPC12/RpoP
VDEPVLRSVRCPQCAGPLSATEARRLVTCAHCGVRILVREHGGYSRWYFPARIDRLRAVGVGSAWLKRHPGLSDGARAAKFVEANLLYAPIWEYKALVAGWEFGTKLRTQNVLAGEEESEHLDLRQVSESVDEPRLNERRFYEAAIDFSAIGATRPRISGREFALPLLPRELEEGASPLEASGTAADIADVGRRYSLAPMEGDVASGTRLFALRESVSLLYYPLWLMRFRDGNRLYEMTVDARSGTIFSARAPAANRKRLLATVAQMAILAVVVTVFLHLYSTWGLSRLTAIVIAVIVSLVVLATARQFRLHGEVEYHEPYSG